MTADNRNFPESTMRNIARELAGKDRRYKADLIARRRAAGLTQSAIDEAYGLDPGTTRWIEAYYSDPTLSQLRRYEALIMLTELQENERARREEFSINPAEEN